MPAFSKLEVLALKTGKVGYLRFQTSKKAYNKYFLPKILCVLFLLKI